MVETKPREDSTPLRRKRWVIPLSIVGVVALAIAGGLIWFFSGEAPAEVDLDQTASAIAAEDTSAVEGGTADDSTGIEGTWVVDTSIGDFTVEEVTTATYVGFRVEEVLNSIGSTTAVGRTPDVSGSIAIEETTLTAAEISTDLTSIVSDESRREDSIQRALNTSSNPTATFVLVEPIELGDGAAEGELVSATAIGDLTINGVTNEVSIELEAQLVDGMVLVTGTTDVLFSDYDVDAPTSPAVLSVEDNGIVEIQLWLAR